MISIPLEKMREQASELYELSKTPSIIYFDEFIKSLAPLYKFGDLPDVIRVAKDEDSLLAGDYEPAFVINIKEHLHLLKYDSLPMWHNKSNEEFSLHGLGLVEGNKSAPSNFTLYDTNPHMKIAGATGHGKSVLANDVIIAGSLVHPPWLAQFFLSDPKITELKPYALGDVLPHVNAVAATADPAYAISVLEYLIEVMNKRASIYANFKVKSIEGFNKNSGLVMPMLILVLDELKSMLATAGKLASKIDYLIQQFVAKARFCGGRAILLSQGVVTELDPSTMKNINIRVALGCVPEESEKIIGNPGAAVNLGTRGKVVINITPEKKLKDNVHLTSPYLPEAANSHSRDIYAIFKHQKQVWEKIAGVGARYSPLSFFDEEHVLKKEEFDAEISGKVAAERIFIGEPAYINKGKYKMAYISLMPNSRYSDNLGNNILILSQIDKTRLDILATLLHNFQELKQSREVDLRVYSLLKDTNDIIKSLGYNVDGYTESSDVADAFARIVQQTQMKILAVTTDNMVFGGKGVNEDARYEKIVTSIVASGTPVKPLMKKRLFVFLSLLEEERSRQIFGLSDILTDKTFPEYLNYASYLVFFYQDFNCQYKQLTAATTPIDIRVFINFHLLQGVEVKTNRLLDLWMSVVRMAPVYGIYFIVLSDMLPSSGSSLNGVFNKILFYQPTNSTIGQFKLTDDYPTSSLPCLLIYADKTKAENKCVKVKFVNMLDE